MRYAFLMIMVLHAGAAMACEVQSDVQAGDNSTTAMMRDCTDQVVPEANSQLPAIPSEGVKIAPGAVSPSAPGSSSISVDPPPNAVSRTRVKPRALRSYKAVVRRLHGPHARKSEKLPMFWWHTRR